MVIVVGLGYIGGINAYYLSSKTKVFVDEVDDKKITKFNLKQPIFDEVDLDWALFYDRVSLASSLPKVQSDMLVVVCVDAPVNDGTYDLSAITKVLKKYSNNPVIVRSTLDSVAIENLSNFEHRNLYYWPEFIREGSALADMKRDTDYLAPITSNDSSDIQTRLHLLLGKDLIVSKDPKALATAKSFSNAFRALKVTLGNSLEPYMFQNNVDYEEFLSIFGSLRGNLDLSYLRPGGPYGGFCLTKEVEFWAKATSDAESINIFKSVHLINESAIERKTKEIVNAGVRCVAFESFAFKEGTDDVRRSPFIAVAKGLESQNIKIIDLFNTSKGEFSGITTEENIDAYFCAGNIEKSQIKASRVNLNLSKIKCFYW
ncbi:hypothetical protein OAL98_03955 [Gammaproteobacteria bacterium]|nr:hypothetical protein [Gammaproteobacteria bacterium]